MPMMTAKGNPRKSELPAPVARSEAKAQRTFAETYDNAMEEYDGDSSRAARVAYSSLKHSYEKVGDHWERKDSPGPSDSRARSGGPNPSGRSAGGVDAEASKDHLYRIAQRLDIAGRSTMAKAELVEAIDEANQKATADSRSGRS
ncbi:hypothetical protein GOHSU_12_00640 [Gordonia hirsuta DSM 44140 = NBRC 16056]|uniref:Rho termination factor N-terminal domain-containing protein n=1 Tax=Gordonia hirsuta DSM 44140 = NBRC 16056 TaxID=1121927 RepID=L7L6W7_9ACTN|nr:ChaB family protein [Gordonia hirsuta]GAC56674.1 hypothetical protein GOHSU_12_00640 [Gordonia hirsuta DSM 44140 = NBRC 16056]